MLDPAQIVEAPSGTLDADRLAGKDATLRVAIAGKGWAPGDGTRLTIRGRSLGGGDVDFILDNRVIGANLGRTAELSYDVIRANATTHSQVLTLTIDPLAEQALDLVNVPQASGSIINANAAHSVVINEWPFMNVGDPVWIDIKGVANLALRSGTPLTPAQFNAKRVEVDLPPDYLRSLPNQSALSIEVRVSLNGSVHKDFAVALRTVNYRIGRKLTQTCWGLLIRAQGR